MDTISGPRDVLDKNVVGRNLDVIGPHWPHWPTWLAGAAVLNRPATPLQGRRGTVDSEK